jgi:hypothetical protein
VRHALSYGSHEIVPERKGNMEIHPMRTVPRSFRILVLAGVAAVLVGGTAAAPAFADDDWRGRHEWREREWRHHEREREWREHEWRERHWRPGYEYYGYPPPVIYAPPPAYYAPPPVAGFNFVFPIR